MDEQQFILRLPPELAERMRLALSSKAKRDAAGEPSNFSIKFIDKRNATFTLDSTQYPATLMDLPCIVESHKFTKKRTFYKSGDVGQVLVVRMPDEPAPESNKLPDGITPAARGAAERLSPSDIQVSPELISAVENTIKCIVDNKVSFVRKKADTDKPSATDEQSVHAQDRPASAGTGHEEDIDEIVIEQSDAAAGTRSTEAKHEATLRKREKGSSAMEGNEMQRLIIPEPEISEQPVEDIAQYPATGSAQSPVNESESMPQPVAHEDPLPDSSPQPDFVAEDEGDDDDGDELYNMVAETMLESSEQESAKARIARADALKRVEEKRGQIAEQSVQADRALNPVIRQRFLRRKTELEAELSQLESQLAELDNNFPSSQT